MLGDIRWLSDEASHISVFRLNGNFACEVCSQRDGQKVIPVVLCHTIVQKDEVGIANVNRI